MRNSSEEAGLLIAPCGMNCGICIGYLRNKSKCDGCYTESDFKPQYCKSCVIKNCEYLSNSISGFCYDCPQYPCKRLKQLDKRYKNKYHMSMIENLAIIQESGLEEFLKREDKKWTCTKCGARLSAHRDTCLECGIEISFNI